MIEKMPHRIEEGMDVMGSDGRKLGKVEKVVVGEPSKEPRFFTIEKGLIFHKDYLVPREAILRVDDENVYLSITRDDVERLPEHEGGRVSEEQARRAYEVLGAKPTSQGYAFEHAPGESGARAVQRPRQQEAGQAQPQGPGRAGQEGADEPIGYVVTIEETYIILPQGEREAQGYRNEWEPPERE